MKYDLILGSCYLLNIFCFQDKLYLRIGRKKNEIYEIDKETLEILNIFNLDPGTLTAVEPKSALFSDGQLLGLLTVTSDGVRIHFVVALLCIYIFYCKYF